MAPAYPQPPPPTDLLTMGFLAMSLGSNNALMLLNHLIGVSDCRAIAIQCYKDDSYRYTGSNGQPSPALDYHYDQKGTVVQQEMWRLMQPGDAHRHFDNARSMQWPIFFLNSVVVQGVSRGVVVGIDLSLVGHASLQQSMVQPDMAASVGFSGVPSQGFDLSAFTGRILHTSYYR